MTELTVRTIHTGEQYVPAICERVDGSDKVICIFGDSVEGLGLAEITVRDHDQANIPKYRGMDYPIERFQKALKAVAELCGLGSVPYQVALRFLPDLKPPLRNANLFARDHEGEVTPPRSSPSVIGSICAELGVDPVVARRTLRAAGLNAPYTDEKRIRELLQGLK